ncbi:MAG: GNAT family N-acetyltransferase [Chloroflexi bacterium]|nr:GNAT family N-acetyltransferase [Chloroflexota bacterium]
MTLTIREATMRDYDSLCGLYAEVDTLHCDALASIFQLPAGPVRAPDYIRGLLDDTNVGLFVADESGRLAGFIQVLIREAPPVMVPRRIAVIENVGVRRDCQRAGIGRALMARAHEWAIARGAGRVELNVYEFNRGAIAFYEALGYETLSRKMTMVL